MKKGERISHISIKDFWQRLSRKPSARPIEVKTRDPKHDAVLFALPFAQDINAFNKLGLKNPNDMNLFVERLSFHLVDGIWPFDEQKSPVIALDENTHIDTLRQISRYRRAILYPREPFFTDGKIDLPKKDIDPEVKADLAYRMDYQKAIDHIARDIAQVILCRSNKDIIVRDIMRSLQGLNPLNVVTLTDLDIANRIEKAREEIAGLRSAIQG